MIFVLLGCAELGAVPGLAGLSGGEGAAPELPTCSTTGPETPAPRACLTGTLTCGAKVSGTTLGGDSLWDDDFYAAAFCFPSGGHHSGAERVYTLTAPANTQVTIRMVSTCVDLDLVAVGWDYDGACPTAKHLVPDCEADVSRLNGSLRIQAFHEREYLVGIDGKDGAVGPYELSVECVPLRTPDPG